MKKTFLAALASLMLAGAISAASGLNTDLHQPGEFVFVGDGTSPIPMSEATASGPSDLTSQNK